MDRLWLVHPQLDLFLFWTNFLFSYILGFAVIQLALALVHTSNQSIIFRLRPDAKSRINAIYMTAYFTGGACGSALGIFHGIMVVGH
jgi:predicted MFS family arabinose efflux permease